MATVPSTTLSIDDDERLYPSSDGKPFAETGFHVDAIFALRALLIDYFKPRPDVFVASNTFWYWEEGNPRARRAPDVMVVVGVSKQTRRSYKSWEENGVPPTVIFEFTSRKKWKEDAVVKKELYAQLGVAEYYQFDPENRVLCQGEIVGYRLRGGTYVLQRKSKHGRIASAALGLELSADDRHLILHDTASGSRLLSGEELVEAQERALVEKEAIIRELEAKLRARNGK